jgi:F0F1-type ATP synthase membrane subunit b/b'
MNDDEIVEAIKNAYANNRDSEEVIEDAEKELEQLNIYRVFAVEANTDVI